MFCRREKKMVRVEEAVAFWEGGFSDGDVITKIALPTQARPVGNSSLIERKGEGKASGGRRQGHQGPTPNCLRTETALRAAGTCRSGFSVPKEVTAGRMDLRG